MSRHYRRTKAKKAKSHHRKRAGKTAHRTRRAHRRR